MPKNKRIKKVLLIGSGPIIIGQAAEFDFSGSQACRALNEEKIKVVLINSNPATIMTDPDMADSVYVEPLTLETIEKIIESEKPDSIIAGIGGQTGLNMASELEESGILKKYNLNVIGTSLKAIKNTENRDLFKNLMLNIGEKVPRSFAITSLDDIDEIINSFGFPLIVRPAYTLGGSGSGIANTKEKLIEIASHGLKESRINQVLIEESLLGWSEIEYEVIRDKNNTCAIVCGMENIDPMGIHTGDSIVIAPIQTLSESEQEKLKNSAIKIIKALNIEGGCNVQFAYKNGDYRVIEVNPRVSRSSALASKATGFPIARYTAKIAIGFTLDEILKNISIGSTTYEPKINYIVVKIPRWPFDKLKDANNKLTTSMKSTGEVMAIGATIEETLMKAIRSLDINFKKILNFIKFLSENELLNELSNPTEKRLFALFEALRRGYNVDLISNITNIHLYFIKKMKNIINIEFELKENKFQLTKQLFLEAKKSGFSDFLIGELLNFSDEYIYSIKKKYNIVPSYNIVDSCLSDLISYTPYYYSTYNGKNLDIAKSSKKKKVLILGSGPIRIGQGIEFDYCTVHAVMALKEENIETIIINNNPETVSTDYDTADKLFFEPLTLEDIINVVEVEKPYGICIQFGGQNAINLSLNLENEIKKRNLNCLILGTKPKDIDTFENRQKFNQLMSKLNIQQPKGSIATSIKDAIDIANNICDYPVLIRPSYVLGGLSMKIILNDTDMENYLKTSMDISTENTYLVDKYLVHSTEVDIDAICDGKDIFIGAIMEHIEEAGIHSGDSSCIIPPQTLSRDVLDKIKKYTRSISLQLNTIGLINIQMAVKDEEVFVLEANPRSSRTIPFVSKSIGFPLAKIAAKVMIGHKLNSIIVTKNEFNHIAIKRVVLPFDKLSDIKTTLGPEMKSTGEVMSLDYDFGIAYYKSELELGYKLCTYGDVGIYIENKNSKKEIFELLKYIKKNFKFRLFILDMDIKSNVEDNNFIYSNINLDNFIKKINNKEFNFIFNPTVLNGTSSSIEEMIRRACIDSKTRYIFTIRDMEAVTKSLISIKNKVQNKNKI